jgi:hypothetical protein
VIGPWTAERPRQLVTLVIATTRLRQRQIPPIYRPTREPKCPRKVRSDCVKVIMRSDPVKEEPIVDHGTPGGIRTPDQLLRSWRQAVTDRNSGPCRRHRAAIRHISDAKDATHRDSPQRIATRKQHGLRYCGCMPWSCAWTMRLRVGALSRSSASR